MQHVFSETIILLKRSYHIVTKQKCYERDKALKKFNRNQ